MSMIRVENLPFSYPSSCDTIFEGVSFQIDTDWKLGLIGRNGRGKTTLLRLLQGQEKYQGRIQAAVQFDYFPYPVRGGAGLRWNGGLRPGHPGSAAGGTHFAGRAQQFGQIQPAAAADRAAGGALRHPPWDRGW